ncbi:MAG: Mrp/NBP35 family ATP-binding protein [Alistipes sp.]|nr:Mrp/NBP35 family ATP-binding protein [Alistipes sp.]
MDREIRAILASVVHPETGENLVDGGFVESITATEQKITVALRFRKARDPFAVKIKNQVEQLIADLYPESTITVFIKQGESTSKQREKIDDMHSHTTTTSVAKVIAVSSGKGGVGKSTVTSNLAVALANAGYRVGVLDADIYGPSQSKMFGVEEYLPDAVQVDGRDYIIPAEVGNIKIISIAMFIRPTDALLWRGTMANSALRQLIHQTQWGELDFLLIDLPPGTGDIHLSIISELKIDGAIIVSTPQQVAVADVVRGVEMFRNPNVNIPVLGVIENMAWFTPAELPNNRYYIFGKGGAARYAEGAGVDLLGQIPIIQEVMEGSDSGKPAVMTCEEVEKYYRETANKVVEKLMK